MILCKITRGVWGAGAPQQGIGIFFRSPQGLTAEDPDDWPGDENVDRHDRACGGDDDRSAADRPGDQDGTGSGVDRADRDRHRLVEDPDDVRGDVCVDQSRRGSSDKIGVQHSVLGRHADPEVDAGLRQDHDGRTADDGSSGRSSRFPSHPSHGDLGRRVDRVIDVAQDGAGASGVSTGWAV